MIVRERKRMNIHAHISTLELRYEHSRRPEEIVKSEMLSSEKAFETDSKTLVITRSLRRTRAMKLGPLSNNTKLCIMSPSETCYQ